ncbi:MAG: uroporphyrinogen decarboxylase family protein [Planctomycetota bacterium]
MNNKQRVVTVLRHITPDFIPYNIAFTIDSQKKMVDYYGNENFIETIGNHLVVAPVIKVDWGESDEKGYYTDEFGVVFNRTIDRDIGVPIPILRNNRVGQITFPETDAPYRFTKLEEAIKENPDKFILMAFDSALFERAWFLRGMEDLLIALVSDRDFVEQLFDAIVAFDLKIIDMGLSRYPEVDGVIFGDDYGTQTGVMMGEDLWQQLVKPRLAKLFGRVKEHGKFVFLHSCGAVSCLFDDLVQIGLDCFNPFQPEVMDIYAMKKKYQGRLSFYGGISVQRLLPFGNPQDVRREITRIIDEIGSSGGYIAGPSHGIPGDIPARNIAAMLEVLQNQNRSEYWQEV